MMKKEYFHFKDYEANWQVNAARKAVELASAGWSEVSLDESPNVLVGGIFGGMKIVVSGVAPKPLSAAAAAMRGE